MVPLQALTHGTPLVSQTTPKDLAAFVKKMGYKSIGLSDWDQLYMCVQYFQAMKSEGLKPMLGLQLRIYGGEEESRVTIFAKNKMGWQELLKLVYEANQPGNYKDGPRLEVFDFIQKAKKANLIIIIRDLFLDIFEQHLPTAYLGLDPISYPEKLENLRQSTLRKVVITPSHYLTKEDWLLNKYLMANYVKSPIKEAKHPVFQSNDYYVLSEEELLARGIRQEEIDRTEEIYEQIEEFDILYKQDLPNFDCPEELSEDEYLRQLCREGFKRLGLPTEKYVDRIKHELEEISKGKMAGYFLIMQDIIRWAKNNKIVVGLGRGSAAGCLTSYLLGIVGADPIQYNLLFERFYSSDRTGMMDIDTDLPPSRREEVVQYIQSKYGVDYFAQLCTFNTLKGAASLKCVLRAIGMDATEQNYITKKIPPEGKIAPYLAKQKEEVGSESMVLWCINHIDDFKQWCTPNYEGVYASEFQAAIELDKIIQGRGRHASAYALANEPIYKKAPLIWDEMAERFVVGVNMDDAEKLGLVKLDLLGVDLLDKIDFIRKGVKNGCF